MMPEIFNVYSRSTNSTKPTPTILIMPFDLNVFSLYLVPPGRKIIFGYIERGRGDEVVEDDIMLFAPAEGAEVV